MRKITFVLMMTLLAGCGSVGVKNKTEAQLMPESVAKRVLKRYFSEDWVENPYGYFVSGHKWCGDSGRGNVAYSDISTLRVFDGKRIHVEMGSNLLVAAIPCTNLWIWFDYDLPLSEQDIADIVDALVSLGSNIDQASASK